MSPEFDEEALPVVVYTVPRRIDDEAIARLDHWMHSLWDRQQQYAMINRSQPGTTADVTERRRITEWANREDVREASRRWCVGSATLVESALTRGALTALLWVWKPVTPHKVVGDMAGALDYCFAQLAAAGIGHNPGDVRAMLTRTYGR